MTLLVQLLDPSPPSRHRGENVTSSAYSLSAPAHSRLQGLLHPLCIQRIYERPVSSGQCTAGDCELVSIIYALSSIREMTGFCLRSSTHLFFGPIVICFTERSLLGRFPPSDKASVSTFLLHFFLLVLFVGFFVPSLERERVAEPLQSHWVDV